MDTASCGVYSTTGTMDGGIIMGTYTHSLGKNVKISGAIARADFDKEMSVTLEGMLQSAGQQIAELMRRETRPYDYTGTLTESIAWRTAKRSSKVKDERFLIDAPDVHNAVDIGSAAPHARYRESGSSVHRTDKDSAMFLSNMRAWVREKLNIDPEQDSEIFWSIVNAIRYGGRAQAGIQNKQPFLAPVEPMIPGIARVVASDAIIQMWDKLAKRYPI